LDIVLFDLRINEPALMLKPEVSGISDTVCVPDKAKAGMKISAYIIRLDAIPTIMYVSTFITAVIFFILFININYYLSFQEDMLSVIGTIFIDDMSQ
jgi:hypothetical protein